MIHYDPAPPVRLELPPPPSSPCSWKQYDNVNRFRMPYCVRDSSCFYRTLDEAKAVCVAHPNCAGIVHSNNIYQTHTSMGGISMIPQQGVTSWEKVGCSGAPLLTPAPVLPPPPPRVTTCTWKKYENDNRYPAPHCPSGSSSSAGPGRCHEGTLEAAQSKCSADMGCRGVILDNAGYEPRNASQGVGPYPWTGVMSWEKVGCSSTPSIPPPPPFTPVPPPIRPPVPVFTPIASNQNTVEQAIEITDARFRDRNVTDFFKKEVQGKTSYTASFNFFTLSRFVGIPQFIGAAGTTLRISYICKGKPNTLVFNGIGPYNIQINC
jgi:hypothetical protein